MLLQEKATKPVSRPSVMNAERGRERYQREVQRQVESVPSNMGKMLALDPETGNYEIADSILTAVERLRERLPEVRPFAVRIGSPTTVRIGAGFRK